MTFVQFLDRHFDGLCFLVFVALAVLGFWIFMRHVRNLT